LETRIRQTEHELSDWARTQPACQRVEKVPGVGLMTATYLVASVGNGRQFDTAKQFASWLGLTPREHSSGGKQKFGGISKRGDSYFRCLLVHGARAVLRHISKNEKTMPWLAALVRRKHRNVAAVAQACKTARILWSMLFHETEYRPLTG
ncbi:IS110 family transposase, partial [Pectobacterium polaris]